MKKKSMKISCMIYNQKKMCDFLEYTRYIQNIHIVCIKNPFVMIALAAITLPLYEFAHYRTVSQSAPIVVIHREKIKKDKLF